MNFLDWLKSLSNPSSDTGVIFDKRSPQEKNRDYSAEERLIAGVPDPFGNAQITESPYPYENQNRTYSCVANSVGLALAIERKMDTGTYARLSPMFAYRQRQNYAGEGCYPQNIFDIYRHSGSPLYTTLPTPQTEEQANAIQLTEQQYNEANEFKGLNYFTINNYSNIVTLGTIAMQGHAVAILIYGTQDEWGREYPEILVSNLPLNASTEIRHSVCVLPYSGFVKDGKRYLTIQDSAWFGGRRIRHLSEEWISKRVYGAIYWDTVASIGGGPRPKYTFTKILRFGNQNPEVKVMQQLLISENLLPADMASGYFGGRTLAAVNAFQIKYANDILVPLGLDTPTGNWGSMSIAKANKLTSA